MGGCEEGGFSERSSSLALPPEEICGGEILGRRPLLWEKFRNLNRRGQWPLVSVEKDSHAQPPLAAMAVFPLSPQTPLSRRAAGAWLETFLLTWFRL